MGRDLERLASTSLRVTTTISAAEAVALIACAVPEVRVPGERVELRGQAGDVLRLAVVSSVGSVEFSTFSIHVGAVGVLAGVRVDGLDRYTVRPRRFGRGSIAGFASYRRLLGMIGARIRAADHLATVVIRERRN